MEVFKIALRFGILLVAVYGDHQNFTVITKTQQCMMGKDAKISQLCRSAPSILIGL